MLFQRCANRVPLAFFTIAGTLCACAEHPALLPATTVATPPNPTTPTTSVSAEAPAARDASTDAAGLAAMAFTPLPLPGAPSPVTLDYIVYEPGGSRVWVPVGDTGSVDVYDIAAAHFTVVGGFKTAERQGSQGKGPRKRMMGPSAASVGDGTVYIGNRASNEVCPVDEKKLTAGACVQLPSPTDGVAYVASAKEVWVTTPHAQSIAVLDASRPDVLKPKTTIKLDGAPEGYAVDDARGLFVTNLEDKDSTVAIDIKTHRTKAVWTPHCGSAGPRGVALERAHGLVLVACTDHVVILDPGRDGATVARIDTGAGVDNIDWLESKRMLFVGAATAGKLTVARIDDQGQPTVLATRDTPTGARNPVADADGNAYEADPANGRIIVFPAP